MAKGSRKKEKIYRERFKETANYHNYDFKLPKGKLSPNQKRAITLQHRKQKSFSGLKRSEKYSESGYKFVKGSRGQLSKLKKLYPDQTTNKGAWVKTPKLRGKKFSRVGFDKKGNPEIEIGNRKQVIIPIDAAEFVRDKQGYLRDLLKNKAKPDAISLQVNGFTADTARDADTFLQEVGEEYFQSLAGVFKREAEKTQNKKAAQVTGIILTYFGTRKNRKRLTSRYIDNITNKDNEPF